MEHVQTKRISRLNRLSVFIALPILLAACGGGVPEEEMLTAKRDLEKAQSQTESLEAELERVQEYLQDARLQAQSSEEEARELRTQVMTRAAADLTADITGVLSINELIAFPQTVVEIRPNSPAIQMISKTPTVCSIAHGITTEYGDISIDDSMAPGAHTDHYHTLTGLQPNTTYHYKWGLLATNGTFYSSDDFKFKTPPGDDRSSK